VLCPGGCRLNDPRTVLVLCTGNSARSILGEVLFNRLGNGRVRAFSAGSKPAGAVNPGAVRLLGREGEDTKGLRSKSWSEFAGPDAPPIDIVITVCGNAAGEACPLFPGRAVRAHWGLADPAAATGGEAAQDEAFARTWGLLRKRIEAFLALPFETMSDAELQQELNAIGTMEGAA
jgi:arsenate reductase (thioredoxin)